MRKKKACVLLFFLCTLLGCEKDEPGIPELVHVFAGSTEINADGISTGLPLDRSITLVSSNTLNQSASINPVTLGNGAQLTDPTSELSPSFKYIKVNRPTDGTGRTYASA